MLQPRPVGRSNCLKLDIVDGALRRGYRTSADTRARYFESAAFTNSKTFPVDPLLDRSGAHCSLCACAHRIGCDMRVDR